MQTPAGKECRFFYGDYYRGRNQEECRLLESASLAWKSEYCQTCPAPEILMANACPHLILNPQLERVLPFFKQRVKIKSYCTKTGRAGFDPHIGCGDCHPLPPIFDEADS